MWRALLGIALALSVLAACGGGPATPTPSGEGVTPTSNLPATATRQAELAELATVRALAATPAAAPAAPTATPQAAATQTRAAELAQLATLTAPTAIPAAAATPTRAASPGRTEPAGTVTTFVGRVADSELFLALVADATRAVAYICDGATTGQWFSGALVGGAADLRSAEGTRLVVTDLAPGRREARGMLQTLDAQTRAFSTLATTGQDTAGLYRLKTTANGRDVTLGAIVLATGESRGVLKQGESIAAVTGPTFGADSLTATVPGYGTFTAPRLTAPSL